MADDKFKILEEKVKALKGPDGEPVNADGALVIKIGQRDPTAPQGMFRPLTVCSLAGGQCSHVASPELWLPQLMGGGQFVLSVYAPQGTPGSSSPIMDGFDVMLNGEARKTPNWDAVDDPSWVGPKAILYPNKLMRSAPASSSISVAAPPSLTQPATTAPQLLPGSGSLGVPPSDVERRLAEERAYYNQQITALNQRLADEQHKRDMDALQAENQRQMAALRAEVAKAAQAAQVPAPKPPDIGSILEKAAPILAPILSMWMTGRAEAEKRAEERSREESLRWEKMFQAMSSRPAIDPMLKEILDQQRAEQLPVATIIQQSAQANAALIGQMSQMLQTQAELMSGPEENPMIKVVREVGTAIQGIAAASAPRAPPRRLPPQPQQQNATPPPPAPSAPPALQVVNGGAGQPPTQALGDLPAPGNALENIRQMLLNHVDPARVAEEAVKAFTTPEFQVALKAAEYRPLDMFQTLMTEAWLTANLAYAQAFAKEFTEKGNAARIFRDEEDDTNENDAETEVE